jgi:hypothetical protein
MDNCQQRFHSKVARYEQRIDVEKIFDVFVTIS